MCSARGERCPSCCKTVPCARLARAISLARLEDFISFNEVVPQVIERWLVQRGIALIPKSTTAERIVQNADIWDLV